MKVIGGSTVNPDNTSFLLWPTFSWYNQMATSQVTRVLFPCIQLHQTSLIHDPRRRSPFSTSKMEWCYSFCLLQISVNKQDLATIKKTQTERHRISKFCIPSYTHSKYDTAKENLKHYQEHSEFILLKIPPSPHKITKTTCQTSDKY